MNMERQDCRRKTETTTVISSYLKNVSAHNVVSREEEEELVSRIKDGNESAVMELVMANLRLVLKIAYRYGYSNCSLLDLINEGNIGLIQAARKFDPEFGLRFASYAVWWIKQAMSLFTIRHERGPISVPVRKSLLFRKIKKETETLRTLIQREPTIEELAARIGSTPEAIKEAIDLNPEYTGWEDHLNHTGHDNSIVEKSVEKKLCGTQVKVLLNYLPENERKGMELYYGLNGLASSNFAEVGRELNMSREGARQLVKRSLKKLRTLPQTEPMRAYL
jgi:RNA polymerase primary sigma factor